MRKRQRVPIDFTVKAFSGYLANEVILLRSDYADRQPCSFIWVQGRISTINTAERPLIVQCTEEVAGARKLLELTVALNGKTQNSSYRCNSRKLKCKPDHLS